MAVIIKKTTGILASSKLTVACLLMMAAIVVWGTLYESSEGLFAARERFFQSWIVVTAFNIPFPGLKLISLTLLANLFVSSLNLVRRPFKNSGLLFMHSGVALLLAGILFSSRFSQEYYLSLQENETASSAYSFEQSEIAIYKRSNIQLQAFLTVDSVLVSSLTIGQEIFFPNAGIKFKLKSISNRSKSANKEKFSTDQVTLITDEFCSFGTGKEIVLEIGEHPIQLNCDPDTVYASLRPVAIPLPVSLHLLDFTKKFHPGTNVLKEVGSHISISGKSIARDAVISMNKPLRSGSFTFYQASFSQQETRETTHLSVVYNPHRLFPYIASLLMIGGFFIHFVVLIISKILEPESGYNAGGK